MTGVRTRLPFTRDSITILMAHSITVGHKGRVALKELPGPLRFSEPGTPWLGLGVDWVLLGTEGHQDAEGVNVPAFRPAPESRAVTSDDGDSRVSRRGEEIEGFPGGGLFAGDLVVEKPHCPE